MKFGQLFFVVKTTKYGIDSMFTKMSRKKSTMRRKKLWKYWPSKMNFSQKLLFAQKSLWFRTGQVLCSHWIVVQFTSEMPERTCAWFFLHKIIEWYGLIRWRLIIFIAYHFHSCYTNSTHRNSVLQVVGKYFSNQTEHSSHYFWWSNDISDNDGWKCAITWDNCVASYRRHTDRFFKLIDLTFSSFFT